MTPVDWPLRRLAPTLALATLTLTVTGCASSERFVRDLREGFDGRVIRPVQYRMAGADPESGRHLEQGLAELRAGNPHASVPLLNRALWDIERIENRSLRLKEIARAYGALASAYGGLGRRTWSDEHRRISAAVAERASRDEGGDVASITFSRARRAYASAQFREALYGWHLTLVELESVGDTWSRVRQLEQARCYVALTHFALEDEDRVKEELYRLWAFDTTLASCARQAPPAVRRLIVEIQKKQRGSAMATP